MISQTLKLIAGTISIYTLLCFVRIILTWFPSVSYSPIGKFLSTICDPYLNMFRKIRWFHFSNLDFTPAIAICLLIAVSTIIGNFALTHSFRLGAFFAIILQLAWSIFTSFLFFIVILLAVRLAIIIMHRDSGYYRTIWDQIDHALSPFVYRLTSFFSGSKPVSYKNALIITIITLVIMQIGGRFIINALAMMLGQLPF